MSQIRKSIFPNCWKLKLALFQIETSLPEIKTDLLEIETSLPEIDTALPEIEAPCLKSRPPCLKSRPSPWKSRFIIGHNLDFQQGGLVQIFYMKWSKLGRFSFDISSPYFDNPTQVYRW